MATNKGRESSLRAHAHSNPTRASVRCMIIPGAALPRGLSALMTCAVLALQADGGSGGAFRCLTKQNRNIVLNVKMRWPPEPPTTNTPNIFWYRFPASNVSRQKKTGRMTQSRAEIAVATTTAHTSRFIALPHQESEWIKRTATPCSQCTNHLSCPPHQSIRRLFKLHLCLQLAAQCARQSAATS